MRLWHFLCLARRLMVAVAAIAVAGWSIMCGTEGSGGNRAETTRPASETTSPAAAPSSWEALRQLTVALLELEAAYPEGFSYLNGVREFPDGALLAADPLGQVLLHIGPDLQTSDTLGRVGPGPQEYREPDQVLALPGDSTLLVDLGKMQLTQIGPDGTFGSGIPMAIPRTEGFSAIFHPRFSDGLGRLYDQSGHSRDGRSPDSVAILRLDRGSRRVDTAAMIWLPTVPQTRSRGGGFVPRMLGPCDSWAVGSNGQIGIFRSQGLSVEWRFPDGRRAVGPQVTFETFPVSPEDKEAAILEMRISGVSSMGVFSRDGSTSRMTMSRGLFRGGDLPDPEDFEWAERLPFFRSDRALVSPRGELWIERYLPVDSLPRVEVFDESGVHRGSVPLPAGRQVIGFGTGGHGQEVVYLVRADEYDLQWLERYRVVR